MPGSKLMVGGKVVESKGLLKHWLGNKIGAEAADGKSHLGLLGALGTCANDHAWYVLSGELGACPLCGQPSVPKRGEPMLLPKHGFSTAAWSPPVQSTDVGVVGKVEQLTITFTNPDKDVEEREDFAGVSGLTARYSESGKLLAYNRGKKGRGFAVCTKCGYADSEKEKGKKAFPKGREHLPAGFEDHVPLWSKKGQNKRNRCWSSQQSFVLRGQVLAAQQVTDVLQLDPGGDGFTLKVALSLGIALQTAGARLLELDPRELGVLTVPLGRGYSTVLYDDVPGGAGHVLELMQRGDTWLREAREALYVDEDHDRRCDQACLDCLLSFSTQHVAGQLDRRATLRLVDGWLNRGNPP